MLERLDLVPWLSFAQPPGNQPSTVPDALRRLASSTSESEAQEAYHRFLYSVGNDHAGTYFPVVLETMPFLEEILRQAGEHARNAVLNALIDLAGSFEPDPEFRSVANGAEQALLRELVLERIGQFTELARAIAQAARPGAATRKFAEELLDALNA